MPAVDSLGRAPIDRPIKQAIAEAFKELPEHRRGALVVIADEHGTRAHLAARVGKSGNWKVAAGAGVQWVERKPVGWIGVIGAW